MGRSGVSSASAGEPDDTKQASAPIPSAWSAAGGSAKRPRNLRSAVTPVSTWSEAKSFATRYARAPKSATRPAVVRAANPASSPLHFQLPDVP